MIKTVWLEDIKDPKEAEKFKKTLATYLRDPVFSKFKDILVKKLESLEYAEINPETYKNQEWAYKMAHQNGYKQALIEVMTLLTVTDR